MQHFIFREHAGKLGKLGTGGEFAVDQQVGGLDERAFFSELGDVVAAVSENALFPVNESDGALAGPGISVARIEGDAAALASEASNIDSHLPFGAYYGRQFKRLAVYDHFHCSIHARAQLSSLNSNTLVLFAVIFGSAAGGLREVIRRRPGKTPEA